MPDSFVGLTDPDWYAYLRAKPRLDEVNFWQPHGGRAFGAIKRHEPFFFKLRAPAKAIAGFGFFERYESMPAWMAWDCFGDLNGAATFPEMVDRIRALRGDEEGADRAGDFTIGCIVIVAPVLFEVSDLVAPPSDWARTGIQVGKRYSTLEGEGKRLLQECTTRARASGRYWNVDIKVMGVSDGDRYGAPVIVRPRLGQGAFSLAVRDAYGGACAVTNEHSTPVLEAAHIRPYGDGGEHDVRNGLLLRRDLHSLFDHGYATVTPDYRFRVSERLREEFKNGRSYYALDGKAVVIPEAPALRPDRELLEWHSTRLFR